jgi:hypothetical protein
MEENMCAVGWMKIRWKVRLEEMSIGGMEDIRWEVGWRILGGRWDGGY